MRKILSAAVLTGLCFLISGPALASVVVCTGPFQPGLGASPQTVRSQATEAGWTCSNGQAGTLQQISTRKRLVSYLPNMGFSNGGQSGVYPIAVFATSGH